MTKEEVLQFVSGNSKYRGIYEKILAKDSLLSMQVMNEILNEEPQDPSDLCLILDQVRSKYRSILGGEPSADELDLKKAKIFLLLKAALVDGSINDKENEALSQMVNAYEYRVPDLDVRAVAAQYNNGKAESILQEAKYGDRIRLLDSIDYIFKADGPLQKEEIGLMRELFSLFDIKPDALGSFNFNPNRVYGIKLGSDEPAPPKVAPQKTGNGMSRDDILETTGRIRDLRLFHDILTSGTAGAERLYEAIADLNINNPLMLTSYLLQNKDELLVYCDDDASRVRTAKTALLMFAAAADGRSEKKDALLTDIADNKIHVYNFEWNQAINWHDEKSEWSVEAAVNILSELPLEEKVEIYNDVVSIFEADGGELSERKKRNLGYLRDGLGLDDDADEDEAIDVGEVKENMVESEKCPAVSNTGSWICPNCGQTGNTGNFCGECGTKRPDPAGLWACPSCGHTDNKGKFCENCGEPRDNKKNKPSSTTPIPQAKPAAKAGYERARTRTSSITIESTKAPVKTQASVEEHKDSPAIKDTQTPLQKALAAIKKQDYSSAIRILRRLSNSGDPEAQFELAKCYQEGLGVKKNTSVAASWLNRSAESGYLLALFALGKRNEFGIDITPNLEQAAKWYRKAAEQGHPESQYRLGLMYDEGRGVKQSDKKAIDYIKKAADSGFKEAMEYLASPKEKPTAVIKKVRIETGINYSASRAGLRFHIDFEVHNIKSKEFNCSINLLYDWVGGRRIVNVYNSDPQELSVNGALVVGESQTALSNDMVCNDWRFDVPYYLLCNHDSKGTWPIVARVIVFDMSSGKAKELNSMEKRFSITYSKKLFTDPTYTVTLGK